MTQHKYQRCGCAMNCGRTFDPAEQLGPYIIVRGSFAVHELRSDGKTWCGLKNDQMGTQSFAYYVAHTKSFLAPPALPFKPCRGCTKKKAQHITGRSRRDAIFDSL